jgi:hypothetical protein
MAIVNRALDVSEQQKDVFVNIESTVTATSDQIYHAPHALELQSAFLSPVSLSGSPTCQLQIKRFVTGAGETFIPLGAALALQIVGTSGPLSYTFSSTSVQAGDLIVATHAGSNAAVAQLGVALVAKAVQDIKSWDY